VALPKQEGIVNRISDISVNGGFWFHEEGKRRRMPLFQRPGKRLLIWLVRDYLPQIRGFRA
jgi:hypothetical protein